MRPQRSKQECLQIEFIYIYIYSILSSTVACSACISRDLVAVFNDRGRARQQSYSLYKGSYSLYEGRSSVHGESYSFSMTEVIPCMKERLWSELVVKPH